MDLVTNYDSDPQRLPRLNREEQRIADAIVAALSPQLQNIDRRLGNIETRLDGVETRLDGIETRLDGVETRLDGVETRLDGVETRLDGVETRLDGVETRLVGVETRLDGVETRLDGVETRLVGVETRLDGVEGSISQQTALIQANHEDIISLQQQMADFREEQNEAWAVNGEVWNRLDANVQLLMDERN